MSEVTLTVGAEVHIAVGSPPTEDEVGFEDVSLTYTEIGEIETLGEFGGEATITNFTPAKTGVVNKRKGSIDYGTMALGIGKLKSDAGQIMLKDGFDGAERDSVHSIKIVDGTEEIYFTCVIGSFVRAYNDANSVIMVNTNLELTGKPVEGSVA